MSLPDEKIFQRIRLGRFPMLTRRDVAICALLVTVSLSKAMAAFEGRRTGYIWDLSFSIFAVQNFLHSGLPLAIDPHYPIPPDVARLELQWLTSWPPGIMAAYALLLGAGLAVAEATRTLATATIFFGSLGWAVLVLRAGASRWAVYALAVVLPWSPWISGAHTLFMTDHMIWALEPWLCLMWLEAAERPFMRSGRPAFLLGLASSLPFVLKYTAGHITMASIAIFALMGDKSKAGLRSFVAFCIGAVLLPVSILSANYLFGHSPAAVLEHASAAEKCQIGIKNILQLFVIPFGLTYLPTSWREHPETLFRLDMCVMLSIVALVPLLRRHRRASRLFWILALQTIAAYLYFMSASFALCFSWNGSFYHERYFAHLTLGWIYFLLVPLTSKRAGSIRWILAALLVWLTIDSSNQTVSNKLKGTLPYRLPKTFIPWYGPEEGWLFFEQYLQERRGEIDFVVAPDPQLANELRLPVITWSRRLRAYVLDSSRAMTALALVSTRHNIDPTMMKAFERAAEIRRIPVPYKYGYLLYIIRYEGLEPAAGD